MLWIVTIEGSIVHQGCVAVCLVVLSVRPTTSHASLNKSTIYSHPDINIGIVLVLEGNCCRLNTFMAVLRLAPFLYSICWQMCCDMCWWNDASVSNKWFVAEMQRRIFIRALFRWLHPDGYTDPQVTVDKGSTTCHLIQKDPSICAASVLMIIPRTGSLALGSVKPARSSAHSENKVDSINVASGSSTHCPSMQWY